ncbi:MAG: hypothetical protein A3G33_00155 [Omnitrophica bacterium RIFCSPLOWO2_12_FULL_44_17]|uniref:Periplasmic heavy metal sensor n=1 Tax=Candidatus Danuiimicrobium aquiferis TaxID=1801832 RepID=A0A1G1KTH4_9BACT|nr:MAG: hypothetical protein A3B72_00240 [Omnitrophica bacterium RIFCSPHIGHO2_02_FULL_45_28]OGW91651.1 MAG: hypothetical protein A3E74_00255 [Omnitrophica bacterium RIFCSPHIGHO2_12_FULL_44_12]OGW96210.1 MAG: hypothetical protein A3G33_00155 [Omnitrophica bacterium RIFCSPLOWO2_12_FULL_44_17]OGX02122.1 MAG: hypothetical protein A3J12_01735 [Omnitrophica bacterium RIFCSPLOWO2_02_FULL_44_11]
MKKFLEIKWHQIIISLLIGIALGMTFGQSHFGGRGRGHWKKEGMKQYMLERFSKELHLSAEQKNQVSAIFEKRHPQMLALQAEMRPKFETLRNATDAEIRALLNADQQKKFDEIHAKMEARWKGHEKFPAPK